jgi:16S rRNA processing protein RimM
MAEAGSSEKVVVGRIGAVFGVKGWLKIHSFTEPMDNILHYSPWYIQDKGTWQIKEIVEFAVQTKQLIVQFAGLHDRESAQLFTGLEIAVAKELLPKLATDEYYWADLEGLTVVNTEGVVLGKVDYLFATGSNDVLVVKGSKQYLIPFLLNQFVLSIDLPSSSMQVDWDADF